MIILISLLMNQALADAPKPVPQPKSVMNQFFFKGRCVVKGNNAVCCPLGWILDDKDETKCMAKSI